MEVQTVVFANFPDCEDLCCVICEVNITKIRDSIIKTPFHCQVLVCRLIIKTVRCAIAAPVPSMYNSIYVIVSKRFFHSGRLQAHLANIHVKCSEPQAVNFKTYITCLKYTFTFHLAPSWNLVGQHYLYSENFLQMTNKIDAMNLEISMDDEWSKLIIKPTKMNVYHLRITELGLPYSLLQSFAADSKGYIDLTCFKGQWVHVIPSMKKGKLISVSKILPARCPFKCYEDFRRHWKNMYAYRLPKDGTGMLFYEVSFPPYSTEFFTYPEICLRSQHPKFIDCPNKNELTRQFLTDLTVNMQNVCGKVLEISNRFPKLDIEFTPQKQIMLNGTLGTIISSGCNPKLSSTPLRGSNINQSLNNDTQSSSVFTFGGNGNREPLSSNTNLTASRLNTQAVSPSNSANMRTPSSTQSVFKKFANYKYIPPNIQTSLKRLANYCGVNDEIDANGSATINRNMLQTSPTETITNFSQVSSSSYFIEPKQFKRTASDFDNDTNKENYKKFKKEPENQHGINTQASSIDLFSDYRNTPNQKFDEISQYSHYFDEESFPGEDEMFNNIGILHDSQIITPATSTTQYSENSDASFRLK